MWSECPPPPCGLSAGPLHVGGGPAPSMWAEGRPPPCGLSARPLHVGSVCGLQSGNQPVDAFLAREFQSATLCLASVSKEQAVASGRSSAQLWVVRRHLWLSQSKLQPADRDCLLKVPVEPIAIFGPQASSLLQQAQDRRRCADEVSESLGSRGKRARHPGAPAPRVASQAGPVLDDDDGIIDAAADASMDDVFGDSASGFSRSWVTTATVVQHEKPRQMADLFGEIMGKWQPARPVAASAASGSQRGQWQPARPVAASAASGSQRGQWQPARLACRRS
ncbi:unnamed protein product [Gadus morhua 'NCC']